MALEMLLRKHPDQQRRHHLQTATDHQRRPQPEQIGCDTAEQGADHLADQHRYLQKADGSQQPVLRHRRRREREGRRGGADHQPVRDAQSQQLAGRADEGRGKSGRAAETHGPEDHRLAPEAVGHESPDGRRHGES